MVGVSKNTRKEGTTVPFLFLHAAKGNAFVGKYGFFGLKQHGYAKMREQ